jgi:hypothetical protein
VLLLQKLEELKRAQEEELEDRLDAGVKRILAANRRLAEELRLHVTVRWWLCCAQVPVAVLCPTWFTGQLNGANKYNLQCSAVWLGASVVQCNVV